MKATRLMPVAVLIGVELATYVVEKGLPLLTLVR